MIPLPGSQLNLKTSRTKTAGPLALAKQKRQFLCAVIGARATMVLIRISISKWKGATPQFPRGHHLLLKLPPKCRGAASDAVASAQAV